MSDLAKILNRVNWNDLNRGLWPVYFASLFKLVGFYPILGQGNCTGLDIRWFRELLANESSSCFVLINIARQTLHERYHFLRTQEVHVDTFTHCEITAWAAKPAVRYIQNIVLMIHVPTFNDTFTTWFVEFNVVSCHLNDLLIQASYKYNSFHVPLFITWQFWHFYAFWRPSVLLFSLQVEKWYGPDVAVKQIWNIYLKSEVKK